MPLLIDCYNVLHAEKPASLAGLGEASLCALLAKSPWVRGGVTVVCDGSPKPHSPGRDEIGLVELIFSGQGRSADDVIIQLIEKDSAPRRLTVVSSDRTIRKAARRRRARDWSAEAFLIRLARAPKHDGGATAPGKPAPGPLADAQVDRWLDWFGIPTDTDSKVRDEPSADLDFDFGDLDGYEDL